MNTNKFKQLRVARVFTLMAVTLGLLAGPGLTSTARAAPNPGFGMVCDDVSINQYTTATQVFNCAYGSHYAMPRFYDLNSNGVYLWMYELWQSCASLSGTMQVPYSLMQSHPDWYMYNKDGSLAQANYPDFGPRTDVGNPDYVNAVIDFLKQQGFDGTNEQGGIGLDMCLFAYGNSNWAKYDTDAKWQAACQYFFSSLSAAFRPKYKIVGNVGSSDLTTFATMMQWLDGAIHETFFTSLDNNSFKLSSVQSLILDRWQKADWLVSHGKIWMPRYQGSIKAVTLGAKSGVYLTLANNTLTLTDASQQVLDSISLATCNTLAKLQTALVNQGLTVTSTNPYTETSTNGTLLAVSNASLGSGLTLQFDKAPREAFLFGYAGFLMASGPNCYYAFGDENRVMTTYPEMSLSLGQPTSDRIQVAPYVYRRNFSNYSVFFNISSNPYQLSNGTTLAPLRGAIIASRSLTLPRSLSPILGLLLN